MDTSFTPPVDDGLGAEVQQPVRAAPEEQDFTYRADLNGRELGQLICGVLSGRGESRYRVRVDEERLAAVIVALVQSGWAVRKREWGGADKQVVLEAWSD